MHIIKVSILSFLFLLMMVEVTSRIMLPADYLTNVAPLSKKLSPEPLKEISQVDDMDSTLQSISVDPKVPHPYLGFVYNPKLHQNSNPQGFLDPIDFEKTKEENVFYIGFFGGSFTRRLVQWINRKDNLEARALFKAYIRTKKTKIVAVNLGVASYKQPQQFIAASLFSNLLDMTINIDGYNEVDRSINDQYPIWYPSYSALFYNYNPEKHLFWPALYKSITEDRDMLRQFRTTAVINQSYFIALVLNSYQSYVAKQIYKLHEDHIKDNSLWKDEKGGLHSNYDQKIADSWSSFTVKQHRLMCSLGVRSIFFLQPHITINQAKILTPAENELISGQTPWAERIQKRYKLMSLNAGKLKNDGVPIFDSTFVFKDVSEQVYTDQWGHLNDLGWKIFLNYLISVVVKDDNVLEKRVHQGNNGCGIR